MATEIAGLPFWELTFDADGDPDGAQRDAFLAEVRARGITDVIVFSHGWNNDRRIANELYQRFFGLLGPQLPAAARGTRRAGGRGVAVAALVRRADPGLLRRRQRDRRRRRPRYGVGDGARHRDRGRPDPRRRDARRPACRVPRRGGAAGGDGAAAGRAAERRRADGVPHMPRRVLPARGSAPAAGPDDGEGDKAGDALAAGEPRMLLDDPATLFDRYRAALVAEGVDARRRSGGGAAGLGDMLGGLLHGAKEALRGATYWQMKNRAGVVGRAGLGPLLGQLPPGVRAHLVGHSFGARLVSFALAGLPDGAVAGPRGDPAAGRLLPVRVRPSAALRRGPQRRARRHARPDQRPAGGLLLRARRRERPVLPAGVVRGAGGLGGRGQPVVALGGDRRERGAGRGRRAGGDQAGRRALRVRPGGGAEHRRERGGDQRASRRPGRTATSSTSS